MRRFFWIVTILGAACSAAAGTTYDFTSHTSGLQASTVAGTVSVDGPHARIDLRQGDGMLFRDGSYLITQGRDLFVFDPAAKTFYQLRLDQLASMTGTALGGGMVQLRFEEPRVTSRDLGDGGKIEGYPTRRTSLDATINIVVDAMGQSMSSRMRMETTSWSTDRLSASLMNVFQSGAMRSGIPALDRLIDAQTASTRGRFPLRQTTIIHLLQNGRDLVTNTTTAVTHIRNATIAPSQFAVPSGYTKVPNPLERQAMRRAH